MYKLAVLKCRFPTRARYLHIGVMPAFLYQHPPCPHLQNRSTLGQSQRSFELLWPFLKSAALHQKAPSWTSSLPNFDSHMWRPK